MFNKMLWIIIGILMAIVCYKGDIHNNGDIEASLDVLSIDTESIEYEFDESYIIDVVEAEENEEVESILLDVEIIDQRAVGLEFGCESMATLMALEYVTGVDFDEYEFGMSIPKDSTSVKTLFGYKGVYEWGDPDIGFVGDITGKSMGSTIYAGPLCEYLQNEGYYAIDLTGSSFESILDEVGSGYPVVAWVSLNMNTPNDWVIWETPEGKEVRVTFSAHSVTITGFDSEYVYYNDSWTATKNNKISIEQFKNVYEWRGSRALVIRG